MTRYKKFLHIFIKKVKFLRIILILVFIFASIFTYTEYFRVKNRSTIVGAETATLLIDFENSKRMFEGQIYENMTVLDALNASVAVGKIRFVYTVDGNNNTSVAEIGDYLNSDGYKFLFFVNDKQINKESLNKILVMPKDKIVVKTEK